MLLQLSLTDAWHSHESKTLLGTFDDKFLLQQFVIEHSSNSEDGTLTDHDMYLLFKIKQTQGRSENYIIDEEEVNPTFSK